jgi:regulator of replication initiation timing
MSNEQPLEQLKFDQGRLQAQVAALEKSMSELVHDMAAFELQAMSLRQRMTAIEEAIKKLSESETKEDIS